MKPVRVLLILIYAHGLLSACASQPTSVPPSSALVPLDTAQAYVQRGDTAADSHEYERAIADYTQAIRMQPDYAEAYNNRGYAYYWQGQYPNAIADYDRAIALRPTYPYAYNNRGAAYMASGDSERAISDFDQAIQQQPDSVQAYTNRANAYLRMGRLGQARTDFRHVGRDPLGWLIGACLVPLLLVVLVVVLLRRRAMSHRLRGCRLVRQCHIGKVWGTCLACHNQSRWPNKRVELTPLRGPKIVAILKAGINRYLSRS